MKCPSEVELNEYAEDRLETGRRWEIQQHLADCAACREEVEGLTRLGAALGALASPVEAEHPADEELALLSEGAADAPLKARLLAHVSLCPECATVLGKLPKRERRARPVLAWSGVAAAAAALVLVVGLSVMMERQGTQMGPAPPPATGKVESLAEAPPAGNRNLPPAPAAPGAAPPAAPLPTPSVAGGRAATGPSQRGRIARAPTPPRREGFSGKRLAQTTTPAPPAPAIRETRADHEGAKRVTETPGGFVVTPPPPSAPAPVLTPPGAGGLAGASGPAGPGLPAGAGRGPRSPAMKAAGAAAAQEAASAPGMPGSTGAAGARDSDQFLPMRNRLRTDGVRPQDLRNGGWRIAQAKAMISRSFAGGARGRGVKGERQEVSRTMAAGRNRNKTAPLKMGVR